MQAPGESRDMAIGMMQLTVARTAVADRPRRAARAPPHANGVGSIFQPRTVAAGLRRPGTTAAVRRVCDRRPLTGHHRLRHGEKADLPRAGIDLHLVALAEVAFEDAQRQRVEHPPLDRPLQLPRLFGGRLFISGRNGPLH